MLDNGILYIGKLNIINQNFNYNWNSYGKSKYYINYNKYLNQKQGYFIFENQKFTIH